VSFSEKTKKNIQLEIQLEVQLEVQLELELKSNSMLPNSRVKAMAYCDFSTLFSNSSGVAEHLAASCEHKHVAGFVG
jgi:hypothetical protein